MLLDYNEIKLEIHNRGILRKSLNMWKLKAFLNNMQIKESQDKFKHIFELNKSENMTY